MISLALNGMLGLLLVTCIVYCVRLEKRLRVFQSTNAVLGEAVAQLSRHTRESEEAIGRFRDAAAACEAQLAGPLAAARELTGTLEQQIEDAELVMDKIGRIVEAASPETKASVDAPRPAPHAVRRRLGDLPDRSRSRFAGIG